MELKKPAVRPIIRPIIRIDEEKCDGCGLCANECAEMAIRIVNGKAKLASDVYCDGLGACLSECPRGAIELIEREAEPFDEEAVRRRRMSSAGEQSGEAPACGCPSARVMDIRPRSGRPARPGKGERIDSALSNWPVQIRLVPPSAPFLREADLLVAADCTAVAYPAFHKDFLEGRVVLVGCPKLDDQEQNIRKFAEIFAQADIRRITALVMEVPCCQGLPVLMRKAMSLAGRDIPMETVVITTRGEIK